MFVLYILEVYQDLAGTATLFTAFSMQRKCETRPLRISIPNLNELL